MGEEETPFGAIVVAGVTMLVGTKLLVAAMVELLSVNEGTVGLVVDSAPVSTAVALVLLVATGSLLARLRWSRSLAILALLVVAVLGRPSLANPEPVALGQTILVVLTILFLLLFDPMPKQDRSEIDESSSATRIGSTLR